MTTCHKAGWELYGKDCLDSFKNWPDNAELHWYTEGFDLPETPRVKAVPIGKIKALTAFKRKYAEHVPPNYLWDVVRFSNKVFAAVDALRDWRGIGVWLDADCVTYQTLPAGYVEGLLPEGAYMAIFQRPGTYTETGFWAMNCAHPAHAEFLDTWVEWYTSGAFKGLANWTDCETLDATIRRYMRSGAIKVVNLSPIRPQTQHPQAESDLGHYIDHRKGARKHMEASPENPNRVAA